jgi:hypothetical protein
MKNLHEKGKTFTQIYADLKSTLMYAENPQLSAKTICGNLRKESTIICERDLQEKEKEKVSD